jgi:hypothetical protein
MRFAMVTSKEYLQIGFRGTEEYRRSIQQAALDRGLKVQRMLEIAVEQYLRSEGSIEQPRAAQLEGLSEEDATLAAKFLRWKKKPKKSNTDIKLEKFILNEIEGD